MTEPIYQFVKGKGWVVGPDYEVSDVYTLKDGQRYRFELRNPKDGEYYDSRWFNPTLDWEAWAASYRHYTKRNLCAWNNGWCFTPGDQYITIVLLDE